MAKDTQGNAAELDTEMSDGKPTKQPTEAQQGLNPAPTLGDTDADADGDTEYEDVTDNETATHEEFEAPWLTAALDKLEATWCQKWDRVRKQLQTQAAATRTELSKMRRDQKAETTKFHATNADNRQILDKLVTQQEKIIATQSDHDTAIQALQDSQDSVVKDI